jgi:hypothetical protein
MDFSSDLCTLSTLTESTLLCSLEQRCRSELTEVRGDGCEWKSFTCVCV